MNITLAIMFTITTYGSWMRGDQRGWIDDGVLMPPNASLEFEDRKRMKHPPFVFSHDLLLDVGTMIGQSLRNRMQLHILALTVQTWHVHFVLGATSHGVDAIVKCAKDAVRWGLRPRRPIWTTGYDKRFCFDIQAVLARIHYVERHNVRMGWPPRPWEFLEEFVVG